MLGSSSTYITPESSLPSWLASRMRCASPPLKRRARAIEREVFEPDVEQEAEPAVDLEQHALGDRRLRCRLSSSSPSASWASRTVSAHSSCDAVLADAHRQALRPQAPPAARVARALAQERARSGRACPASSSADSGASAAVRRPRSACPTSRAISVPRLPHVDADASCRPGRTAPDAASSRRASPRRVEVDVARLDQRVDDAERPALAALHRRAPTARSRRREDSVLSGTTSSGSTSMRVPRPWHAWHMPSGLLNEKLCGLSSGKPRPQQLRASLNARVAAAVRIDDATARPCPSCSASSTASVRRLRSSALTVTRSITSSIVVLALLVERRQLVQALLRAVDAHAHEAARRAGRRTARGTRPCGSRPAARATARAGPRPARAARRRSPAASCALTGLPQVAVLPADARVEHAHVVVDLGDGADGRARIARRALLLDRDRRRQAAQALDRRTIELAEELPRVRAQALDVAALAFGVQRVERQAALARAAHAREHHVLALGDAQVVDSQVVRARAGDFEVLEFDAPARTAHAFGC